MKLFFPESESLKAEAATFGFHSHATRTRAALASAGALVDRKEDADERTGFPLTAAEGGYRLDSIPWRPIACGARVSVRALVKKMEYVYSHYPEALERGRRASERIHAEFTWARTAEKLIKVCREKLN